MIRVIDFEIITPGAEHDVQVIGNDTAAGYVFIYKFKLLCKCEEGRERQFVCYLDHAIKIRHVHEIAGSVPTKIGIGN